MFYSVDLLSPKGALGQIWILAHQPNRASRLNRHKSASLSVSDACSIIMKPPSPLALRLAALLMRGVVTLYSRQERSSSIQQTTLLHFFFEDCSVFCTRLARYTAHASKDRHTLHDGSSPLGSKKNPAPPGGGGRGNGNSRRQAVTREFDQDDALCFDDERTAFDSRFAEIALDFDAGAELFFATAEDGDLETGLARREDELEFGGGGRATNANGRKNVARLAGPHTRDDLTLPDQGMDDLMCRAAGGDLYNRRVGGVGGNENEFNPFDINDSQRLPEYDPHEYDSDNAGLPPLPLDDDDETYQPSKPTAAAQGTGTGTGTGTGLNVTHSSVAPSPAALELEAAARNRGMNQVQPVRKQRAARPGTARHRMQTIDAETHLGGDAYRMWLHDNSDTILDFGRPFPADLHVDITRDAQFFTASDEKIVREGFFDACFLQGDRGGILFKADAADGVCYQLRDHFASFFEARRQPWPVAVPLRQRNARDEPGRPRHPEEDLAAEAEALAEEAEREMAMERQRERRGRAKHLKRSEALGDLSSDDEGGYKPGPIAMGGEDDEHYLPPMDDDDEHELPPMDDDDDGAEAAQNHDAFRNTRAPNRNGLSLADLLEGCSVDETHSFSVGVSQNKSGSQGEIRSGDFFGSENAGDAPSSIGAAAASASRSKTKSLTQYVLKKSCTPGDSIDATGAAMNAAANSASVGNVGSAAYNLMQFLARAVFVEPPGVDEDGADGDGNKNDAKKHQPLRAASLQTLCVANALSKSKAARCFYQTLVLVGGGFLDVKQDLSVPYGEILIRPGKRFEAASGGKRARAEEETEDDEESGNSETDADEGEVPEVSHEMTEVSEDVSEVPESPPGRVPARRSKRARRG